MITKELQEKTLLLDPIDKIHLVEILLNSLDKPDSEIEKAWVEESERRYSAYKNGETSASSLDTVKKRLST